jgi:nitrogenase molybdenum-iron protein alpha/beta subunit
MISYVISKKKPAGGKTVRRISEATGVSVDDILSGVGVSILRARRGKGLLIEQIEARNHAAKALSEIYGPPPAEFLRLFDETGILLPSGVPVSSWFDIGRATYESSRSRPSK